MRSGPMQKLRITIMLTSMPCRIVLAALTGAVSRYKLASRAASPPGSRAELTAVNYSLAAAEAQKADAVALENQLDKQRREIVTKIYKLRSQQRRVLSSAAPTRHIARLGAGPVPGGELTVPPRRGPRWQDACACAGRSHYIITPWHSPVARCLCVCRTLSS